jgi:hypothetical protein
MWVGKSFPEDEDDDAKAMQHEVYGTSVSLIVETAHQAFVRAQRTVGVSPPESCIL